MRVYEFAKEHNLVNKELLAALREAGFPVANHMALLTPEAHSFLEKKFSQQPSSRPIVHIDPSTTTKADAKATPPVKSPIKTNEPQPALAAKIAVKPQPTAPLRGSANAELSTPPVVASPIVEQPVEPRKTTFEEDEDAEAREQARIQRLLNAKNLAGIPLPQIGGQPRRRRRRKKYRAEPAREAVKAPVTKATLDSATKPLCEVADLFGKPSSELIVALLRRGMVCNRNHILSADLIQALGESFGIKVTLKVANTQQSESVAANKNQTGGVRAPVVVVMGHVDHGKTTLLDFIRKMNVAASEKGGITQHVKAWEVDSTHGKIVFLDTPGHAAFSYMRKQGSKVTDIAILVVAADDGIMPQTIEAIKHAKDAGVPIIVAINKIDKNPAPAALETIKRQLSQHELMPEEWGGQTMIMPISAKTGQGVDRLLEMIILQAQLMDLKAPVDAPAHAFILESHIEKGLGPVASALCRDGILKVGDYFVAGTGCTGKIRLLIDTYNKRVSQVGPSIPVQIVGFDTLDGLGDELTVVSQQEYTKARGQRIDEATISAPQLAPKLSLQPAANAKSKVINLIIKTDTRGSKEAVMDSIDKLVKANKEVKCPIVIVASSIGDINESDIDLANNAHALIVGLHTKVEKNAQSLARELGVTVELHGIIYELIDSITKLLLSKKEVKYISTKVGEANVLKVFDIKGVGVIAGCYMREGVFTRGNKVECIRNGRKVGEGKISTLQRDRKTVKEVHSGYECGFTCDGFTEWREGDTVLCYTETKVE